MISDFFKFRIHSATCYDYFPSHLETLQDMFLEIAIILAFFVT